MQSQGSLQETELGTLLQQAHAERVTGALYLEQDNSNSSLFFLFGHLFHAEGSTGKGEDVVLDSLAWRNGDFTFDPRAKLPPEETITASPSELIAQAQLRAATTAAGDPEEPAPETGVEWASNPEPAWAETGTPEEPVADYNQDYPSIGNEFAVPEEPVSGVTEQESEPNEVYHVEESPAPEPEVNPDEVPEEEETYQAPESPYEQEPEPGPEPEQEESPAPAAPAAASSPSTEPDELLAYPLPSGTALYEGLKTSFIDFSRLLRTLKNDTHTGYLLLRFPDNPQEECCLLFLNGDLVEGLSTLGTVVHGERAFVEFRKQMDAELGLIDVVEIEADVVTALSQFYTGQQLYSALMGRFIDFSALLTYLQEQKTTGHLLVTGGSEIGLILLHDGAVLGSYTEKEREPKKDTERVNKLTKEQNARIEVRTSSGSVSPLDIQAMMGF